MAVTPYFPPPPSYQPSESVRANRSSPAYYPRNPGVPRRPNLSDTPPYDTPKHNRSLDPSELRRPNTWRILSSSSVWTLVDEWWLWELISWTFAALCMAAIAGLLAGCSNKPIPTWPWGLTINAYVSILGAFVKAALLLPTAEALGQLKFNWFMNQSRDVGDFQIFDQASRGPWGSLVLILKTKGRALGAFGASIVLLSIALDPFFQQVVVYPLRRAPIGSSTITRSRLYTAGRFDPYYREEGYPLLFPDRALHYYLQPLFFYNITPALPDVPLTCSTGDCSWEPYDTLGVCNECSDVSHLLEFACLDSQGDWFSDIINGVLPEYPKRRSCGYYINATSSDPMLMTGYDVSKKSNETLLGRMLPLSFASNYRQGYFNGSVKFKDVANPIVDAIYVFTPGGHDAVERNMTPIAKECSLRWCVQKVNSTIREGVLHEDVLSTIDNRTAQPSPIWMNWTDWDWSYNTVPRITLPGTNESFGPENNQTAWTVTLTFYESMRAYFTYHNTTTGPLMRFTILGANDTITLPGDSTFWNNPHNVSTHFDNIARALSRVIRISGNGTDEIQGLSMGPQTYVSVRWEWFSLPLILLGCSLAFLVSVMIQCRTDGVKIWKTSALAVLMHGLNDEGLKKPSRDDHAVDSLDGFGQAPVEHGRVLARLRNKSGRWRFSHQL